MLRLQNKFLILLCAFIFFSCGFADLRPIGIKIEPDERNSLLEQTYSPIILKFDTEVIKHEAENIIQVNSEYGSVKGDTSWEGNNLYFTPIQGWTAGIRYTLSLAGTVRSLNGRELRLERFIPFFAVNKNDPPVLDWHYPVSGSSVSANIKILEFHFSCPMDKVSVESALTIDGSFNKTFEWLADNKILNVILEKALSPWTVYRWSVKDSAKSADGVPLPKTYSGYFITNMDQILPYVKNVYPVILSNGSWIPTGKELETGLQKGENIAVLFNKPMSDNVLNSLRFEPSLTGRAEFISEDCIVYILTRNPDPKTIYTMTVSGDTRDIEGLKIGFDYIRYFTPDIPVLNIPSILINKKDLFENLSSGVTIPVQIDAGINELSVSIYFSLPFGLEEKLNTPQRITLSPFFPRGLPAVAIKTIDWISNDRLFINWEGLKAAGDNNNFYTLKIPGGKNGITSENGFYMNEDFIIYLEAVK